MPEIQYRPPARLSFILGDNVGLQFARSLYRIGQRIGVFVQQGPHIGLEPGKKGRIADRTVLDDLRQARLQLTLRQRGQCIGINEHNSRLVKCANQVLAFFVIHPGLAADG